MFIFLQSKQNKDESMLTNFFDKIQHILATIEGWIMGCSLIVTNFIMGYENTFTFVLISVFMDLAWGVASAIRQHRFAVSELARQTFSKLAVYMCVLVFFVAFDRIVDWDGGITFSFVASAILLVECWSACASALIVFPDMPFLNLLKRALIGEIASKLNVSIADVDKTLANIGKQQKN